MTRDSTHIILNVNLQGFGQRPAAWRVQDVEAHDLLTREYWQRLGRIAERGRFDAVFFADNPSLGNPDVRALGLVEPFVLLQAIAEATENLGLVGSASSTYNDPLELAERLLSLDAVTGGRLAWNVVTTYAPAVSGNFGVSANPPREQRYARAGEFIDAVRAYWHAAETGEEVRFRGEHVTTSGRIRVPRSPQGHPVLFQAGGSDQGRALAAAHADAVFSVELNLEPAIENRRALRAAAAARGRRPDDIKVVPGLSVVLGSTPQEANDLYDEMESLAPDNLTLNALSTYLEVDLSSYPLDEPIPEGAVADSVDRAGDFVRSVGYQKTVSEWVARNRHATIRELARGFGGYGARIIVGTPEQVADSIEEWFRAGAADGFNMMIDRFPEGFEHFVDHVVPLLQQRGLHRREYDEKTLRGRIFGDPALRAGVEEAAG